MTKEHEGLNLNSSKPQEKPDKAECTLVTPAYLQGEKKQGQENLKKLGSQLFWYTAANNNEALPQMGWKVRTEIQGFLTPACSGMFKCLHIQIHKS